MAIAFKNTKGKAASNKVDSYAFKDGDNKVRIFGGVLPRYMYWVKGTNDKDIPIECLAFDREKEKFTNVEHDYVQSYFPDKKCQWSYSVACIDPTDGKAKVLNLKKKLFEQILTAAEDLGDPTDPDTGWDICFKRTKTGPLAFNVEYTLQVLKCKPRALNEEERAAIAGYKDIDLQYPRPTPEEVKALCEKILNGAGEEQSEAEQEAAADLP
jgi:hypothetical protein